MKKQRAFTLVELMVVMAIIAILATAGISAYANYIKNARDSARLSIASQVETAVNALMGSNGGVPPTATELIAELDRMNMTTAMNSIVPQEPLYLSALSDTLENIIGAPALFGQTTSKIKEPSGGRPICLGYDGTAVIGGQSCAFHYIVYGDNTYVIGYGVETESNMKKNFYKVGTAENGGTPKYMQVKGTAQYISLPSIGETNGPGTAAVFVASKVTVNETTGAFESDVSSEIVPGSSGLLSANDVAPNPCDACVNGETCVDSICIELCGGVGGQVCSSGQVCSTTSNTCIDLCGGTECPVGQVCSASNTCVTPDPCPIKTPGEACTGGAKYAGTYGAYYYMVAPGDSPSKTWALAVTSCNTLDSSGYASGWFLPTYIEMTTLLIPNKNLIGGFTTIGGWPATWYWSSSEKNSTAAWMVGFADGAFINQEANKTDYTLKARCMRKYQ